MARPPVKSRQYYEAVEKLLAQNMDQAGAINQVADQMGLHRNVVRAGWYRYGARHADEGPSETSFEAHITRARKALEAARDALDDKVLRAQADLDRAQAALDQAVRDRDERLNDLSVQIEALGQRSDTA